MNSLLLLFLTAMVAISTAENPEAKAAMEAKKKACQEKVGATEDDMKLLHPPHTDLTDGAKKILACILKEDKAMVDGKFSPEGFMESMEKVFKGDADLDKHMEFAKEVGEKCATELNDKTGVSEEEMAAMIVACLHKEAKEKGIKLHDNEE